MEEEAEEGNDTLYAQLVNNGLEAMFMHRMQLAMLPSGYVMTPYCN